jgi:type IV fimbrial biogenesis protein FimT
MAPGSLLLGLRVAASPSGRSSGLTLIELIVALAVGGILLAIAVPSYRQMLVSNRLSTAANAIVDSLTQARLEAIRRNTTTQFCSNVASSNDDDALGTACGTAGGAAYVLNADNSTTKLKDAPVMPSGIVLGTGVVALRYGGQGLARTATGTALHAGLVADVSSSRISSNNHRCIYVTAGSIVSSCAHTNTNGGCPTSEPANCQSS